MKNRIEEKRKEVEAVGRKSGGKVREAFQAAPQAYGWRDQQNR